MSRSIELGRAVLGSPALKHELWLTTLITISPKQDAAYLQQLKADQCLEMLASGGLWVGRGHVMHVDLKITIRKEALSPHQLQDLAEAILQAPIWNQLMLKPTLPLNDAVEPGTVHLDIIHATTGSQKEQKYHRLFPDVPVTDVQPPEGVVSVCLQSVSLSIDILETSPRRKPTAKRSDRSAGERSISSIHAEDRSQNQVAAKSTASRKRKRPGTETRSMMQQVPINKPGKSTENTHLPAIDPFFGRLDLYNMVDASLRLSICGALSKAANISKIKASTFRFGLADVAPSIWKNGYLAALSQRAHLLPTLTRSLQKMGYEKAASLSLKDKFMKLGASPRRGTHDDEYEKILFTNCHGTQCIESIASQLWIHSQASLLSKPTTSLQACVASDTSPGMSGSDDMLAEEEQTWSLHVPSTPGLVDSCHVPVDSPLFRLAPSASSAVAQKTQQYCPPFGHEDLDDGPWKAEDDLLLDPQTHSDMTLMEYLSDEATTSSSSLAEGPKPRFSVLAQQPTIQQAQRSFGRIKPADFSSSSDASSGMGSASILPDEGPVIEESGDHNIDCADEILLAF